MKGWTGAGLLAACLAAPGGCATGNAPVIVPVVRTELVVTVEATGSLQATQSTDITPPAIASVWRYKIAHMIPESSEVKKGKPLVSFDTSDLKKELENKMTERDQTEKEIEKHRTDLQVQQLELAEKLIRARSQLEKAERKIAVPESLTGRLELQMAFLERDQLQREVEIFRSQQEFHRRSAEARLATLERRHERAEQRVRQLEEGIRSMTVTAPRDGLVIYVSNWRGEKRKIGDTVSRFEKIVQLPVLERMEAEGVISELDAGRVGVGQAVQVRLETEPGRTFTGRVARISPTVRRESRRSPRKVYRVVLSLDRTDRERMRPGMRFRAEIEVDRVTDVLAVPVEAVASDSGGLVVFLARGRDRVRRPVELGVRTPTHVEVLSGLAEGDRIILNGMQYDSSRPGGAS